MEGIEICDDIETLMTLVVRMPIDGEDIKICYRDLRGRSKDQDSKCQYGVIYAKIIGLNLPKYGGQAAHGLNLIQTLEIYVRYQSILTSERLQVRSKGASDQKS